MDLTRSFVEKIEEMAKPNIVSLNGYDYSDKELNIPELPNAQLLTVNCLTGLIDYLESGIDGIYSGSVLIHVLDFETVHIKSPLSNFRSREFYIESKAMLPKIDLNRFISRESFNIMLQSCFKDQGDRAEVLSAISKISLDKNSGVELGDDGISQSVEAVEGAVLKTKKTIPNPVKLSPFRTFHEIEQPESDFVLRVNENLQVGLFEADGGAWKQEAMIKIRTYLQEQLGIEYTIIA